jgi:hypothetical protein
MPGYSFYGSVYEGMSNSITVETNPYSSYPNEEAYKTFQAVISAQTAINSAVEAQNAAKTAFDSIAAAKTSAQAVSIGTAGTSDQRAIVAKDVVTLTNALASTQTFNDTTGSTIVERKTTTFAIDEIDIAIRAVQEKITTAKNAAAIASRDVESIEKMTSAITAKTTLNTYVGRITTVGATFGKGLLDAKTNAESATTDTNNIVVAAKTHTNNVSDTVTNFTEAQTAQNTELNNYNTSVQKYNTTYLSSKESVTQLSEQANKTFTLLIIWFIIALFIFVITILTLLNESTLNPFVIIIVSLFLLYIIFYFSNNIYNMF